MATIKCLFFSTLAVLGLGGLGAPAFAQPTEVQAQVLRTWFFEHVPWPYPSAAELAGLAAETLLSAEDVTSWLTKTRVDHHSFALGQDLASPVHTSSAQAAADGRMEDLDLASSSSAAALQPPAAGPELSSVELLQTGNPPSESSLGFGRGIIAGKGFGIDPSLVRVTYVDKYGGFYIIENIDILSDGKIQFDLDAEAWSLARGRFIVTVNGSHSSPKRAFIGAGGPAAASAASQAEGGSPAGSRAAHKRKDWGGAPEAGSSVMGFSSGSEGEAASDSDGVSSGSSSAGSAEAPPAKKAKHYSPKIKEAAVRAYLEADRRWNGHVTMDEVALKFGVPRRTLSDWLARAGMKPRLVIKTYSPEEKTAALSRFRMEISLGSSRTEAALATGISLNNLKNWERARNLLRKAYSMAEKAEYKKQISGALARGIAIETIAEDLGLPATTVNTWVRKMGAAGATRRNPAPEKRLAATARASQEPGAHLPRVAH